MVETFIIALATLLVALYVQARRAAREIRARTELVLAGRFAQIATVEAALAATSDQVTA